MLITPHAVVLMDTFWTMCENNVIYAQLLIQDVRNAQLMDSKAWSVILIILFLIRNKKSVNVFLRIILHPVRNVSFVVHQLPTVSYVQVAQVKVKIIYKMTSPRHASNAKTHSLSMTNLLNASAPVTTSKSKTTSVKTSNPKQTGFFMVVLQSDLC